MVGAEVVVASAAWMFAPEAAAFSLLTQVSG